AIHQERAAVGSEDEFLVSEESDIRLRPWRGGDQAADIVVDRIWPEGGGRPMDQRQDRGPDQDRGDGDARPQEARRIAVQLELPPELVRVVEVAVAEEAEPDRRRHAGQHSRKPARRWLERGQRTAAIEGGAERKEEEGDHRQDQRLLEV